MHDYRTARARHHVGQGDTGGQHSHRTSPAFGSGHSSSTTLQCVGPSVVSGGDARVPHGPLPASGAPSCSILPAFWPSGLLVFLQPRYGASPCASDPSKQHRIAPKKGASESIFRLLQPRIMASRLFSVAGDE
jgi:hypothetical protein